jgi:hypothetical protein
MQRQDFRAKFHRFFHFDINDAGIWFDYKGDEVCWMFPWKRNHKNKKYLSVLFECEYSSLKEMDDAWEDYSKAEQEAWEKEYPVNCRVELLRTVGKTEMLKEY